MLELLNRYSHGFAAIPVLAALRAGGALERVSSAEPFSAEELTRELSANRGYLEASLRLLESLGWNPATGRRPRRPRRP